MFKHLDTELIFKCLLSWLKDDLPAGVRFDGPTLVASEKAFYLLTLTERPEKNRVGNMYRMKLGADYVEELIEKLARTVIKIDLDDATRQFALIQTMKRNGDILLFDVPEEIEHPLQTDHYARDLLRNDVMLFMRDHQ